MADFQAPLADIRFLLNEVFDVPALWARLPGLAEVIEPDTASAILEEGARLTEGAIAPLSRNGDEQGCRFEAGTVYTPDGYPAAYRSYAEGGWVGLGGDPAYGGMGMPKTLAMHFEEMVSAADTSFGLYPMLTSGACLALLHHASDAIKDQYLPKLYSGEWAGAMCLTEAHAGSDLGIIRTRAVPAPDGSYTISGTKIFITGGEQDLTDNIIHLVLAKLPDSPPGSKGISMFVVPKFLVNADGSLGERNGFSCGSIEHKMGIKASATCVMNFDGARGWMVGEANRGLSAMFTMMNYERLGVGLQGIASGERSYQNAVAYARERLQGRSPTGNTGPEGAEPIINHPDVRRMLLTMRAFNEGGRALASYTAQQLDIAKYSKEPAEQQRAEALIALLTPVVKAFCTDRGLDTAVLGQQIFGGHGYIREWGQEQLVRDVRIAQIYEGTNGIQAMDFIGRKVLGSGGKLLTVFTDDIQQWLQQAGEGAAEWCEALIEARSLLLETAQKLLADAARDSDLPGTAAVNFQDLFGYVAYAYIWARQADAARRHPQHPLSNAKLATARFYYAQLLPRIHALKIASLAGSDTVMALAPEAF